jgi:glycosyltransferase involved in cell wall biosynthesis
MKIAAISTYAPERCGIAYFSESLMSAMQFASPGLRFFKIGAGSTPPTSVDMAIERSDASSVHRALQAAETAGCDALLLQHEFGLFGGDCGCFLIPAIQSCRIPVVAILHTILRRPSTGQLENLRSLVAACARVIAPSPFGRDLLVNHYGVQPDKVEIIPHGCPDFSDKALLHASPPFEHPGRTVVLSYGLLSPAKRLEDGIDAIARLAASHPKLLYIIAGATHPNLLRAEGERYRRTLEQRRDDFGVDDHILFLNRHLTEHEIYSLAARADIALCAYEHQEQIVSGTLTMMMAAGKAIVATPFWHARDACDQGAALLVPFGSPDRIAEAIAAILADSARAADLRERAQQASRANTWPAAGERVLAVLDGAIRHAKSYALAERDPPPLPFANLTHIEALTTSTGILEHCRWSIPNFAEGYSTDDNARALMLCCAVAEDGRTPPPHQLANTYLAFLLYAFNDGNGRFRNVLDFDNRWQDVCGSEECHARALRALVHVVRSPLAESRQEVARELFAAGIAAIGTFASLRAKAIALIAFSEAMISGISMNVEPWAEKLGCKLSQAFEAAGPAWPWPESMLNWGNAKVAHALIAFGDATRNKQALETGLATLDWLLEVQTTNDGLFAPVAMPAGRSADAANERFDQQPIEAWSTLAACSAAYRATNDPEWRRKAQATFDWFRGGNIHRLILTDKVTGACYDGLTASGVNRNQGAESALAWQLAVAEVRSLGQDRDR